MAQATDSGHPSIELTAFRWVPPFAQGLVRDLRVRWALEEAGIAYQENLITFEEAATAAYRLQQPFSQVPFAKIDGVPMFESGAVVLDLAERSDALMPAGVEQRAQVRTWMFAALNTIEPPISMLVFITLQPDELQEGTGPLRATVEERVAMRLDQLAAFLGSREHLVGGRFTAADLLTVSVLRTLRSTDLVTRRPTLDAYRLRGEARPAFQRALAAQLRPFAEPPAPTSA